MASVATSVPETLTRAEANAVSIRDDLRRLRGDMAALCREITRRLAERRPDAIGGEPWT